MRNIRGLRRGGPGRPRGVPNKATVEVKDFCSSIVDDPAYQQAVRARALKGKLAPAIEAMLWYYAKGKPKELVEHLGRASAPMRSIIVVAPGAELPPELTAEGKGEYER